MAGEAVDFWRVEEVESPTLLRLRAEMKVPGKTWLQFEVSSNHQQTNQSELVQTALFEPKGQSGTLYWYLLYPLHRLVFNDMVNAVAKEAEKLGNDSNYPVAVDSLN